MNRRHFLHTTVGAAAFLAARRNAHAAFPTSLTLTKFHSDSRLPRFGFEIPVLDPPNTALYPGVDYYEIEARCFRHQLHPELPAAGQRVYGYVGVGTTPSGEVPLGGAVLAKKDRPVRLKFASKLPATHILPFDSSVSPSENGGARQDRAAIHLHGGLVPWASDGGPFHWVSNPLNNSGDTSVTVKGSSVKPWLPDASGALTDDYYYPNQQSARFMWYHDHAIGITRTNAYAGLASGYIVYDDEPNDFPVTHIPAGWDIPLVVQDHSFWDDAKDPGYKNYVSGVAAGDLWYPWMYDTALFGPTTVPAPLPSAVPEFWADTMLVNGHVYPWHPVQPRRYRLRILNACSARFLRLSFVMENGNGEPVGGYNRPTAAPVGVWQVGTEGGFLPYPTEICKATGAPVFPLVLGPAERADLFVDFSACPVGAKVLLYNDAPAPFPAGAPLFDYFPGNNRNPAVMQPGKSPNTRTLMRFTIVQGTESSPIPDAKDFKKGGTRLLSTVMDFLPTVADPVNGGLKLHPSILFAKERHLTLNEAMDEYGRLAQLIGSSDAVGGLLGVHYTDEATEKLSYGSTEIWNIYNLSADTHPMHFHLFNVMVLRRRPFRVRAFTVPPLWSALGRPPEVNETGWKETVQVHPGECTTVAVRVDNPLPTRKVDVNNAYVGSLDYSPREGVQGYDEYVWHCHILEHEEHDMMRPLLAK